MFSKRDTPEAHFNIDENAEGAIGGVFHVQSCSNPDCRRTTIDVEIGRFYNNPYSGMRRDPSNFILKQRLLPQGTARVFPNYIPPALLEDYREACLIRDLSPKASATLVRRCIQGMIRDFCGIEKATLHAEINALKELADTSTAPKGVTQETVEAIDQVRRIGNIGAHMEKHIDQIIPVEPDEAAVLISLVEILFEEWYMARHRRQEKLASIKDIAATKEQAKKALTAIGATPIPLGALPQDV